MDFMKLQIETVDNKIRRLSSLKTPQEDFIFSNLNEWDESETKKMMLKAQEYYGNNNDIKDRKRYFIDRKGIKQEAVNLSNSRLSHPFFRKLTNQKVNYLLGREFSIQVEDNEKFEELIGQYINKQFLKMLKNIGRDAIINGIAWVQVYYDQEGNLKFKRIPSEEIIPFWADADHTILDAVIRVYTIIHYQTDGTKKEITKIEYHTTEGVWYYEKGDKGLKEDPDKGGNLRGHFVISQEMRDDNGSIIYDDNNNPVMMDMQATWEKVPFVAFKYNADEMSLLKLVKTLIDDYDINTSNMSNHLQDIPDSIKIVKNYDGMDKAEFTQNLNIFRTAFVSGDGDVKSLTTPIDTTALDSHLNRLRKDIYEAGSGIDTQEVSLGNASGVALKFRYADLSGDTDGMATEFAASLEELIWFIKVDMLNRGLGNFMDVEYDIIFNTDGIINESEIITDAKNSLNIISDETIVANHPWVTDTRAELERIKAEREESLLNMIGITSQNTEFGTENPLRSEDEQVGED